MHRSSVLLIACARALSTKPPAVQKPAELVGVLEQDRLGEDKAVLIDSFRLSEMRTQVLDGALHTLSSQGEIFVAAGIVYLDPAFITSLVSPRLAACTLSSG